MARSPVRVGDRENSRQYGAQDLYLRSLARAAVEPRRVVVEFHPDEYRALEAACRGRCISAAELVRVVATRLAGRSTRPRRTAAKRQNVSKPACGKTQRPRHLDRLSSCSEATSGHFAGPHAIALDQSGGLEVPSSNLGAPIEKRPCKRGLFGRKSVRVSERVGRGGARRRLP